MLTAAAFNTHVQFISMLLTLPGDKDVVTFVYKLGLYCIGEVLRASQPLSVTEWDGLCFV